MSQPSPYPYPPAPQAPSAYYPAPQAPSAPPTPYDPYRATAPAARFAPLGGAIRWVFAVIVALMGLGFGVAVVGLALAVLSSERSPRHQPDDTLMILGMAGMGFVILLLYAQIAAGLVWVHKAWSWLPMEQRYTRHWKSWIAPSQASLMLLIPYFHYYWMFVVNCGLCDALDRLRLSHPTQRAAPKGLAIAACICQLVIPFPVGSILWLLFMSRVEQMTREMSAGVPAGQRPGVHRHPLER